MTVNLNPYLGFRDQAREALDFYHSVFGGELKVGTFGEMMPTADPADADKVMHGQIEGEHGVVLMASDAPTGMEGPTVSNISVSLSGDDEAFLTRCWNGLAEGANVIEPLTKAPWGDTFGMLTDRFGITWLVNVSGVAA
ncbi:VOC family protein [Curtobacterium sp. ISL-83]|uniref:VOC family protein n=1 Tax=Curtobacterium sp. ISL-83 TaxID=2819145 RepID=UPI001BEB78C0|nr:VOC family protein [Curtobacterium sp. ISL-83]MBT2503854.1 VOC family protein [Curtobacterium sp. ISL-83]